MLILLIDSALIACSYYTQFNKEQWREAASYIQEREETGDLIIINAPWLELNFQHYYNGNNTVRGVQTIDQLDEALLTTEHNKLWLILSHDSVADPDGKVKTKLDNIYHLNWEKDFVSQDLLNSMAILGYPINTGYSSKILIYHYSK